MPDIQQLFVLALALVPGFIATEVQSFVALRRQPPALQITLYAIAYSALLYVATAIGSWGPQFDPFFTDVTRGNALTVLLHESILLRYLALLGLGVVVGFITGHSLARGYLRAGMASLAGRNVIGSTWQEFFHDRPGMYLWTELKDGRRIVGIVTNSSDSTDESVIVLIYPHIVAENGDPVSMNLGALLLDTRECTMIGVLPVLPDRISLLGRLWSRVRFTNRMDR